MNGGEILYRQDGDGFLITTEALVIEWFWFPTGSSRVIKWSEIRNIDVQKKRSRLFIKTWGMAVDFQVWWHCASRLSSSLDAIIIDVGGYPKIGITPKYVELVASIIRQRAGLPGVVENSAADEFEPLALTESKPKES